MTLLLKAPYLDKMVDRLMSVDAFAFDVETRPGMGIKAETPQEIKDAALDPMTNEVYWIQLATYGETWVIPMGHPNGDQIGWQPKPLKPGQKATKVKVPKFSEPPVQMTTGDFFSATRPLWFSRVRKVNQDVKFDLLSIGKYLGNVPSGPYTCTHVQAHIINENRALGLKELTEEYFGFKYDKLAKNLMGEPFNKVASYCFYDAKYAWLAYRKQLRLLEDQGLTEYANYANDVTDVLVHMAWPGQPIRADEVGDLDVVLRAEMAQLEHDLFATAGGAFNLSSPGERGHFVYEVRKHKPKVFTKKTKVPSTAEAALKEYEGDPMVSKMMKWSDIKKLHSTYVENYTKFDHRGRLHPNFKQTGTVTGRFSCAEPNLQNVPRPDTPVGAQIRRMFWAGSDDARLVVADYSQIELRILAHMSQDPRMIAAFENGEDIHQATADTLGVPRVVAKSINFLIPYGGGPGRLQAAVNGTDGVEPISLDEAKAFYYQHQDDFPAVWAWIDKTKRMAHRTGYVETLLGRKRRVPEINMPGNHDYAKETRAAKERQAVNARIQGSAADLIGMAMVRAYDALEEGMYLTMQVHDEIVVVTPQERADDCLAIIKEAMTGKEMQMLNVRVDADFKIVNRWSEAKEK